MPECGERTVTEVFAELERAEAKHPAWPDDDFVGLAILTEEVGEAAQAMIEERFRNAPHASVRAEMVQVAAMALQWLINDERKKEAHNVEALTPELRERAPQPREKRCYRCGGPLTDEDTGFCPLKEAHNA